MKMAKQTKPKQKKEAETTQIKSEDIAPLVFKTWADYAQKNPEQTKWLIIVFVVSLAVIISPQVVVPLLIIGAIIYFGMNKKKTKP